LEKGEKILLNIGGGSTKFVAKLPARSTMSLGALAPAVKRALYRARRRAIQAAVPAVKL